MLPLSRQHWHAYRYQVMCSGRLRIWSRWDQREASQVLSQTYRCVLDLEVQSLRRMAHRRDLGRCKSSKHWADYGELVYLISNIVYLG